MLTKQQVHTSDDVCRYVFCTVQKYCTLVTLHCAPCGSAHFCLCTMHQYCSLMPLRSAPVQHTDDFALCTSTAHRCL